MVGKESGHSSENMKAPIDHEAADETRHSWRHGERLWWHIPGTRFVHGDANQGRQTNATRRASHADRCSLANRFSTEIKTPWIISLGKCRDNWWNTAALESRLVNQVQ